MDESQCASTLHKATFKCHATITMSKIDVIMQGKPGETALHEAALCGHTQEEDASMSFTGIRVNIRDNWDTQVLHNAVFKGNAQIVVSLLFCSTTEGNIQDNVILCK